VLLEEVGDVVDLAMYHEPAALLCDVLLALLQREGLAR
jgi:hypothetical protein